MRVLVACEFSGIVRDAFSSKGHDAWSCDILPTESKGNHIEGDVLGHLDKGWDIMIAHPPCTYLSNAGARWLFPLGKLNQGRYEKGLKAKEFFLKLLNSSIPKIAVENPTPSKVFNLPEPTQGIQPFQFGHPYRKKTLLWLKNLNPLLPTEIVSNYSSFLPSNTGLGRRKGHKYTVRSVNAKNYSSLHSKTFRGIAEAMAKQWGILI